MKEFEKFIGSPYFNKGRNYLPLYKVLKSFHPEFNSPGLTEANIFKKLNSKEKLNEKKTSTLRSMLSRMNEMSEKFMVYEGFETGKFRYYYNAALAERYRGKGVFNMVQKILLKNSAIIDKEEKNHLYYFRKYNTNLISGSIAIYLNQPNMMFEQTRNNLLYIYASIFDSIAKYLNLYFVMKRRYNFDYKGYELIKQFISEFNAGLFEKECEDDLYETKNIALINYYLVKSRLNETDKNSLINALDIYMRIFLNLSNETQFVVYELLFNRLFGRIRFDILYLEKANTLIDFVFGKGVINTTADMCMMLPTYHSALQIKAVLLNSKKLREFINVYSGKVEKEYAEDIKNYSIAYIYLKDKLFEKCLEQISKKDSLDTAGFKINRHKLRIICQFELLYFENTLATIDSFEHYLRNNIEVSEIVKSENFKFINGIKKLIRMKLGKMKELDFELKEVLELTQNSLWGYWFKEKIKEL